MPDFLAFSFWRYDEEFCEDCMDNGYSVELINDEYAVLVPNDAEDDDLELIVYFGVAGSTKWVTRVEQE